MKIATLHVSNLTSLKRTTRNSKSLDIRNRHNLRWKHPKLASLEYDLPEVDGSVEYYQKDLGVRFDAKGNVLSFEGSRDQLSHSKAFLYDRHHWGRFRIEGVGALNFLQNKTTQEFIEKTAGQGCDACFCTSKGKVLDLATIYVQKEAAFVILSPEVQENMVPDLEKFIFPEDKVQFSDMRSRTRVFSLYGHSSQDLLQNLNIDEDILEGEYGSHRVFGFNNKPVIVAKGNEIDRINGFTLIVDDMISGDLYKNLLDAGGVPIGFEEWEIFRTSKGRPFSNEISKARNPFELDVFHAINLDKGCFLGQESISRIYTRNAIRQRMWGLQFSLSVPAVEAGSKIFYANKEIGSVSSTAVPTPNGNYKMALGFLSTKLDKQEMEWDGKAIRVNGNDGICVALPYMTFDFMDGKGSPLTKTISNDFTPDTDAPSKEEKLKAMQERLDAFLKQNKQM